MPPTRAAAAAAPAAAPCSRAARLALLALLAVAAAFAVAAVAMPQVRAGVAELFGPPAAGPAVQLVHARWCGHCRDLLRRGGPWAALKAALPGVRFVELDEAGVEGAAAVKRHGVEAFPDVRVLDSERRSVALYGGERTAKAMRAWVLSSTEGLTP